MNEHTQQLLTYLKAHGATLSNNRVQHVANTTTQANNTRIIPLLATYPLQVSGQDQLEFLHGQLSNDVKGLAVGAVNTSLMLNYKGHALALMRVYRRDEDVFVAVEGNAGTFVHKELDAHIIFDQVTLADLSGVISCFTLQGSESSALAEQVLGSKLADNGFFTQVPYKNARVLLSKTDRTNTDGVDVHVLTRDATDLLDAFIKAGAKLAGEDTLNLNRVLAGVPDAEHEGGEGVLPQEAELEFAVSYRKGCYLGQEIMARIEARGNVRRSLRSLRLSGTPAGTALMYEGKPVGKLGTVAVHADEGVIALAVVRRDVPDDATLMLDEGAVQATFR